MYSIKVESQEAHFPVIDRSMSSDSAIEMLPVIVEMCKTEFNMLNPVAMYAGDNVYHIFDIDNPLMYAKISIIKNAN